MLEGMGDTVGGGGMQIVMTARGFLIGSKVHYYLSGVTIFPGIIFRFVRKSHPRKMVEVAIIE